MTKAKMKLILKVLSLISIACFFLPVFTVSCGGQEASVSGFKTLCGFDRYDVDGQPAVILLLLMSIAVTALVFFIKSNDTYSILTAAISLVDFIGWIVFKNKVEDFAYDNGCGFSVGILFYVNQLALLGVVVFAAWEYLVRNKISLADVGAAGAAGIKESAERIKQMVYADPSKLEYGQWICPQCNSILEMEDDFCGKCGMAQAEAKAIMAQREAEKKAEEERLAAEREAAKAKKGWTCPNCGAILEEDHMFCNKCGFKKSDMPTEPESAVSEPDKKFCRNCGNELDADAVFCPKCGTRVE